MSEHLTVKWWGHVGRRAAFDGAWPDGQDLDLSDGRKPCCETPLPYPTERTGVYEVECRVCGLVAAFTATGQADDPRSLRVACQQPHRPP